jgi:hypothetical protein
MIGYWGDLNKPFHVLAGIFLQPLTPDAFSKLATHVTEIEREYPFITETFVIWQNKLVYGQSGNVANSDTKGIWRHLVGLAEEQDAKEREEEKMRKATESKVDLFFLLPNVLGNAMFAST